MQGWHCPVTHSSSLQDKISLGLHWGDWRGEEVFEECCVLVGNSREGKRMGCFLPLQWGSTFELSPYYVTNTVQGAKQVWRTPGDAFREMWLPVRRKAEISFVGSSVSLWAYSTKGLLRNMMFEFFHRLSKFSGREMGVNHPESFMLKDTWHPVL